LWLELGELGLGHFTHVCVGEHGLGIGDAGFELFVLAQFFDGGFEVAVSLGDFAVVFLIGDDAGVRELASEVFVAGFELVEAIKHKGRQ